MEFGTYEVITTAALADTPTAKPISRIAFQRCLK